MLVGTRLVHTLHHLPHAGLGKDTAQTLWMCSTKTVMKQSHEGSGENQPWSRVSCLGAYTAADPFPDPLAVAQMATTQRHS